jgi:nucleoside-diphosphate-sugar epimerase
MKVFITGGTGLLGTHLALHYAGLGTQVVAVGKQVTNAERQNTADLREAGVEVVLASITDEDVLRRCVPGSDLVFHIAAAMREANMPDQGFWDVNVEATRRLLELSRAEGVKRFVYCSSIGVLGKSMHKPSTEESPCNPQDIYQVTKKAAEDLCLEYQKAHNFPLSVVRPADVYGPRDRRLLKLFKGIKKRRFLMIGSGKNEHHMVHAADMVQAFRLAAEVDAAIGEVFIIAEGCPVRVNRLVEMIAEATGSPVPRLKVPLLPVQALAIAVERVCKPFGIQPPLYPRRVDFFRTDYGFDISKAKRILGYQPQYDLRRGLQDTLTWYEQHGLL